jgi:hypothetical protein
MKGKNVRKKRKAWDAVFDHARSQGVSEDVYKEFEQHVKLAARKDRGRLAKRPRLCADGAGPSSSDDNIVIDLDTGGSASPSEEPTATISDSGSVGGDDHEEVEEENSVDNSRPVEIPDIPVDPNDPVLKPLVFRSDVKPIELMCAILHLRRKNRFSWDATQDVFDLFRAIFVSKCPTFPCGRKNFKKKLAKHLEVSFRFVVFCLTCHEEKFSEPTDVPPKEKLW